MVGTSPVRMLFASHMLHRFYGIDESICNEQFCCRASDHRMQSIHMVSAEVSAMMRANPKLRVLAVGTRVLQLHSERNYRWTQVCD